MPLSGLKLYLTVLFWGFQNRKTSEWETQPVYSLFFVTAHTEKATFAFIYRGHFHAGFTLVCLVIIVRVRPVMKPGVIHSESRRFHMNLMKASRSIWPEGHQVCILGIKEPGWRVIILS